MKYLKIAITLIFFAVTAMFLSAPKIFMQSFLDGITVWAYNVLPALFPFAVLTPLAAKFFPGSRRSACRKLFGVAADEIYVASLLCGYPIGAKAISESVLGEDEVACACAFCSSASPVFVVATVGASLLQSKEATLILAFSHLISTVVCGLVFRKKRRSEETYKKNSDVFSFKDLGNTLTSAVLSVLSVGGLIALFYMLTDMIKSILPQAVAQSAVTGFLLGLLEMTNGIISVCAECDLFCATVLCSFLLAFGGMCVFAQSMTFLSAKGLKPQKYLGIKIVQGSAAAISAFVLGKIFL